MGMKIKNSEDFKSLLSNQIAYYRLSGYWSWNVKKDHDDERFAIPISEVEVIKRYELDRQLRILLLDLVEIIEVQLRATIVHALEGYGTFALYTNDIFLTSFISLDRECNASAYTLFLNILDAEIQRSNDVFIKHYKEKYNNFPHIPVWMAVEVMSFGTLSKLFSGLKRPIQRQISGVWGIDSKHFGSWIHCLTVLRNACAHQERLMQRKFNLQFRLRQEERDLNLESSSLVCFIYIAILLARRSLFFSHWKIKFTNFIEQMEEDEKKWYVFDNPVNLLDILRA